MSHSSDAMIDETGIILSDITSEEQLSKFRWNQNSSNFVDQDSEIDANEIAKYLYNTYGQRKSMGIPARVAQEPHYFLLRTYLDEQDLLLIFNTKRCRYQCFFCDLPRKSTISWIGSEDVISQFCYVLHELKHSLSVVDRLTLSNEGSVLDENTFPADALMGIIRSSRELRRVRRIVLETRLEFVKPFTIEKIKQANMRATVDILTGFETYNPSIRKDFLGKTESIDDFMIGLDKISECGVDLTAYVLFKPSPEMSDSSAFIEAKDSINFLREQCCIRDIPLTIRLNPMYAARNSWWTKYARSTREYQPPRLSDILKLAEEIRQEGVRIFIGLSTEGLANSWGTYADRDDYSSGLLKRTLLFNSLRSIA